MKLSIIFLSGIVLAVSDMAKASNCTAEVDAAQGCAKQCGRNRTSDGANNLLSFCSNSTSLANLTTCCQMEEPCVTTMENANQCLDTEFANVRTAAVDYFNCTLGDKCPFGEWCVNIFAGGYGSNARYGSNATNDFSVAFRQADSCQDENLSSFGYDACDALGTCCEACKPQIAGLVNAVMDDILLTTYGQPGVTSCGAGKTCDDYLGVAERKLYDLVGPADMIADYEVVAKELARECNNGLTDDVILYNESYAVTAYFDCLYKKTGKAAALLDDAEQAASSGISLTFGPAAALSAIVSVVYAIVA